MPKSPLVEILVSARKQKTKKIDEWMNGWIMNEWVNRCLRGKAEFSLMIDGIIISTEKSNKIYKLFS